MNIWSKMITALKGGVNEVGESVIDEHALHILDRDIRDSAEELNHIKNTLAAFVAKQKVAEETVVTIRSQIKEHEGFVISALNKNDDVLAFEISEQIAQFENQKAEQNKTIKQHREQAETLRDSIRIAEIQLKKLKQQTETIKANEALQRAQQVVAKRYSPENPRLRTALDSLERIKEKQRQNEAEIGADIEMARDSMESDLDRKLRKAGITNDANAKQVLNRIKNKKR